MNDVLTILSGSPWLAIAAITYVAIILFGGVTFSFPSYGRYRRTHPGRHRIFLAAYCALVFTPSIFSDFFLFAIPAPATFGLLAFAPGLFISDERPAALLVIVLYYLLPLLVGFAVFYFSLSFCSWCRARHSRHDQAA
jgi:hypothetical protein